MQVVEGSFPQESLSGQAQQGITWWVENEYTQLSPAEPPTTSSGWGGSTAAGIPLAVCTVPTAQTCDGSGARSAWKH